MFSTKSSGSSPRPLFFLFLGASCFLGGTETALPQAVPSQANIDASAQRRLQESSRESQKRQNIEQQIRIVARSLSPQALASGPIPARKALAALIRLREMGIPADEALQRAARSTGLDLNRINPCVAYLRSLVEENSGKMTPKILDQLTEGQDPELPVSLPPYQP